LMTDGDKETCFRNDRDLAMLKDLRTRA